MSNRRKIEKVALGELSVGDHDENEVDVWLVPFKEIMNWMSSQSSLHQRKLLDVAASKVIVMPPV